MKTVTWSSPIAIESVYYSRIVYVDGNAVGEMSRYFHWQDGKQGPWIYGAHVNGADDLGEFDDAWEAMGAMEAAVRVRPVTHAEAWNLPGADRMAREADDAYLGGEPAENVRVDAS